MVERNFAGSFTLAEHTNRAASMETRLRQRADRLGMSISEMLEHDALLVSNSPYPTPECLDPFEVEQLFFDELSVAKQEHLTTCAMCSALVEAAHPPEAWFRNVLKSDDAFASQEAHGVLWAIGSRFLLAVAFGGTAVIVCVCAFVLYQYVLHDALGSVLVRDGAWRIFAHLALCTAALSAIAFLSARFIMSPRVRWSGAMAIVTLFAAGVTLLTARDYSTINRQYEDMAATQGLLVKQVAAAARHGTQVSFLTEEAPGSLPGWIIAKKGDGKAFSVLWNKASESADARAMPIGKIYEGKIQRVKNVYEVRTKSAGNIRVSAKAIDPSIKDGDEVIALVPDNTSNVSQMSLVAAGR